MAHSPITSMHENNLQETETVSTPSPPILATSISFSHLSIETKCKEHDPSSESSSSIFPFNSLPPELRNKIYHYPLVRSIVYPYNRRGPSHRPSSPAPDFPSVNLLLVSSQIYKEASGIFYYENLFSFGNPNHLRQFVANCGKEKARVRKLEITPTRIGPKGDRHERAAYRHFMLWFRNTRWILRLNLNLELFRIDTTALPEETVDDFEQNFEIDRMMILILWELGLKSTKTDIVGEWKVGSVAGQRIRPT